MGGRDDLGFVIGTDDRDCDGLLCGGAQCIGDGGCKGLDDLLALAQALGGGLVQSIVPFTGKRINDHAAQTWPVRGNCPSGDVTGLSIRIGVAQSARRVRAFHCGKAQGGQGALCGLRVKTVFEYCRFDVLNGEFDRRRVVKAGHCDGNLLAGSRTKGVGYRGGKRLGDHIAIAQHICRAFIQRIDPNPCWRVDADSTQSGGIDGIGHHRPLARRVALIHVKKAKRTCHTACICGAVALNSDRIGGLFIDRFQRVESCDALAEGLLWRVRGDYRAIVAARDRDLEGRVAHGAATIGDAGNEGFDHVLILRQHICGGLVQIIGPITGRGINRDHTKGGRICRRGRNAPNAGCAAGFIHIAVCDASRGAPADLTGIQSSFECAAGSKSEIHHRRIIHAVYDDCDLAFADRAFAVLRGNDKTVGSFKIGVRGVGIYTIGVQNHGTIERTTHQCDLKRVAVAVRNRQTARDRRILNRSDRNRGKFGRAIAVGGDLCAARRIVQPCVIFIRRLSVVFGQGFVCAVKFGVARS